MPLLTLLVGALVGANLGHGFDATLAGGFIGLIVGLVASAWRKSRTARRDVRSTTFAAYADDPFALLDPRVGERLRALERRVASLEASGRSAPADAVMPQTPAPLHAAPSGTAADHAPMLAPPAAVAPTQSPAPWDARAPAGGMTQDVDSEVPPVPAYGGGSRLPPRETAPREPGALWKWITGGNTLARVGVVVLFIGVAFLLKYASEHVQVPIEVRLAGVALGAVIMLVLGWRLRGRRAGYAMTLQGAAVGVLYLTVFAALRLYQLLSPVAAFGLLFWIAALSSFLAVRQDSLALAVLAVVGGFAAPVLTSSGGGSHVMLFAYYAVLNAGIFAIAWFKAWRVLNLAGFACTFVVGTLWGVTRYRPEDLATTEPFLILFFAFYVAIATLYALRRSLEVRRYVDATLVFGTPLVAAGLQGALVRHIEYALAWSAIGASAVYLVLARFLYARRRDDLRLLVESFLALGIVFATLAVPLALDARLTSATWALEGAALVWVGVRQRHLGPRAFGLLLQVAAGIAFALGFSVWTHRLVEGRFPVLNSDCIGALLVACGGLVSARVLARARADVTPAERALVPFAFAWGVLWWLCAGWREIDRFVPLDAKVPALVGFLAGTAILFAVLAQRLAWTMARVPALALPPALLLIALYRVVVPLHADSHLLAFGGFLAWPFAVVAGIAVLRQFERASVQASADALDAGHALIALLVTLIVADELAWFARSTVSGAAWRLVSWELAPALMLLAIGALTARAGWPFATRTRAYRVIAAIPLVGAMLIWTVYANVTSTGDASPLPYVPLINPLDLVDGLVIVAIALWVRSVQGAQRIAPGVVTPELVGAMAAGLLLFWVTCGTLRTLHHWADVPWSLTGLWTSRLVQSALSIAWSLFALAAMVIANRRRYRVAWIGGAALLAVVVAKLFFVDLSQVGGVERIVSFMGVGVLLLIIGYTAPVPPREAEA